MLIRSCIRTVSYTHLNRSRAVRRVKRLRVMLKAVKPVVLVPAAVKEQGLGLGRAAVKAAARVLAVVLEAAAAVGQVREAAAVFR